MRRDTESAWSMDCSPDLVLRLEDGNLRTEKTQGNAYKDGINWNDKGKQYWLVLFSLIS